MDNTSLYTVVYILVRNTVTNRKEINIIEDVLVLASIIPIVIGYDKLTINKIAPILEKYINSVKIDDVRMISIFGYANTFAAYLGLIISLAIGRFFKVESKKKKALYAIYILISAITLLLTQSKAVLAIIAVIILILVVKGIKDKKIKENLSQEM